MLENGGAAGYACRYGRRPGQVDGSAIGGTPSTGGWVPVRHEGANQYEETGTPVSDVSQLLGHTNIATTSRYLRNKRRRMAQLAVNRLDHARAEAAQARALATDGRQRQP